MLGSSILEVAPRIGLFFLLLAVICTSINEIIARILGLRADNLRAGSASCSAIRSSSPSPTSYTNTH